MEWVDGNIGSKVTMKYPAVYLMGEHAKGETLSIAFAGEGQHQDAGAKMVHMAPNTSSNIVSKSVARGGGRTSYRGLVEIGEGAAGSKSNVLCDALLVDTISRSDTYPYVDVREDDVSMGHEATVSKVSEDQLFYLMSRGMTEFEAMAMIVRGFVEPIAQGAADGVRAGAQPADRAADGRRGRLTPRPPGTAADHPPATLESAESEHVRQPWLRLRTSRPGATTDRCHRGGRRVDRRHADERAPVLRRGGLPGAARPRGGVAVHAAGAAARACTTAPPWPTGGAARSRSTAPEGVTVETVGRDDARRRQGRQARWTGSPPRRTASFEKAVGRHGPQGGGAHRADPDRRARRGRHRLRPPGRRARRLRRGRRRHRPHR